MTTLQLTADGAGWILHKMDQITAEKSVKYLQKALLGLNGSMPDDALADALQAVSHVPGWSLDVQPPKHNRKGVRPRDAWRFYVWRPNVEVWDPSVSWAARPADFSGGFDEVCEWLLAEWYANACDWLAGDIDDA